jgi:hypothetical protein
MRLECRVWEAGAVGPAHPASGWRNCRHSSEGVQEKLWQPPWRSGACRLGYLVQS